ncbi:hypothetical protein Nepgr_022939 [Nepenthes gracilis]|uniref:Uncharacterized protein n=1 Tax=Nepenthes gracilis TaxID=150966 RepID=A0AAD3T1S6_NEPGR|nr:hypothetical protein Nepgr_022939 [Nepenthes gracilis]
MARQSEPPSAGESITASTQKEPGFTAPQNQCNLPHSHGGLPWTAVQNRATASSGQLKHTSNPAPANSFHRSQQTTSSIAAAATKLNPLLPPQQAETNAEHQLFTLAAAKSPCQKTQEQNQQHQKYS